MVLAVRKKKYKSGVWPLKVIYNNGRGEKTTRSCFTLQTSPPRPQSLILAYQVRKETQLIHKLEV